MRFQPYSKFFAITIAIGNNKKIPKWQRKKYLLAFLWLQVISKNGGFWAGIKVGRIIRLINNAVCRVCYENGLELDLGTSEWQNLLFYSYCIDMILVALKCNVLSGCSSFKSQPTSKCYTILKSESQILLTFINIFFAKWEESHFSEHWKS